MICPASSSRRLDGTTNSRTRSKPSSHAIDELRACSDSLDRLCLLTSLRLSAPSSPASRAEPSELQRSLRTLLETLPEAEAA